MAMTGTAGMLVSLQEYYQLEYTKVMGAAILAAIGSRHEQQYLLDLYAEVINAHSSKLRCLPDVAIINACRRNLNPPYTYLRQKQLEAPRNDEVAAFVKEVSTHELTLRAVQEERDRVRRRVEKGDATVHEAWWLECVKDAAVGAVLNYHPMPDAFAEGGGT